MTFGEWVNIASVGLSTFGAILTATWWLAGKMQRTQFLIETQSASNERSFSHLESRLANLEERLKELERRVK